MGASTRTPGLKFPLGGAQARPCFLGACVALGCQLAVPTRSSPMNNTVTLSCLALISSVPVDVSCERQPFALPATVVQFSHDGMMWLMRCAVTAAAGNGFTRAERRDQQRHLGFTESAD
ncbi:hypothetical protein N657DRAFT_488041 [Parathielavia appendiculata]|uniref:Uncharacterized protein n=1 Tax=Parathielavia appendiculata TaxID=2587402 RepID=A0AAN6Z2U5_9PEZI|nr:hypothetical protein N657DRAFT_488041 [Parathielavia appendiculata]